MCIEKAPSCWRKWGSFARLENKMCFLVWSSWEKGQLASYVSSSKRMKKIKKDWEECIVRDKEMSKTRSCEDLLLHLCLQELTRQGTKWDSCFSWASLTLSGKEKGHRLGTSSSWVFIQDAQGLWMKLKEQHTWVWISFRDSGSTIEIEAFLSCFCREPWAGSCLHQKNSCLRADSVEDKAGDLTGPNEDDLGVPCGDLKREAGRIIAGQLGSSLLPDPAQEPDSLLRDNDYILDLFASLLLTTVFT